MGGGDACQFIAKRQQSRPAEALPQSEPSRVEGPPAPCCWRHCDAGGSLRRQFGASEIGPDPAQKLSQDAAGIGAEIFKADQAVPCRKMGLAQLHDIEIGAAPELERASREVVREGMAGESRIMFFSAGSDWLIEPFRRHP